MILPWLGLFDFATVRANFKKPLDLAAIKTREKSFAVLIPIFNDTKYLTNLEFLKKYREHVILCTTTNESEEFYKSLRDLSDKYGFRISYSPVGDGRKNPWAIYNKTLLAHDAVLKDTLANLTEKYVIFIDGDTFVDGELETLAGAMVEKSWDIASVKILPTKRTNLIEQLQGVEYNIAMQARLIYPWLTSGAGMIAKREVMQNIMKNHSLFFNGGDIEIGRLADMMGYKVGHIPMVFYTDIPETFGKWVKQRFSWMCGCFRHSIINFHHNLRHPFHFIYFTFIIYILYPMKVVSMFTHWYILPFIIALYAVITYFANWKVRSKWMIIFPFYALFQILVILWFGIYRYFITVWKSKNVGRIKMKHNPNNVRLLSKTYGPKYAGNFLIITSVISGIMLTSDGFTQEMVFGRRYETGEIILAAADLIDQSEEPEIAGPTFIATSVVPEENVGQVAGVSDEKEEYTFEVREGDSAYKISRRAVNLYVKHNKLNLLATQKLYFEDSLSEDVLSKYISFSRGETVTIKEEELEKHLAYTLEALPY